MADKKTAKQCIADNDFDSALHNLYTAHASKVGYWFNVCNEIFEKNTHLATLYRRDIEYRSFVRVDSVNLYIPIWRHYDREIFANGKVDLLENAGHKCYLFRFFDAEDKLVCSKVGTTTKSILERLKRELADYEKDGIVKAVIDRVYDCGTRPAEGMESRFRSVFIEQYPECFRKNDRFFKVAFDLAMCDTVYTEYYTPV
jgi:hypothetical protein